MIDILRQCWKTLKLYGSKENNFEERSEVFIILLGDYPADSVVSAFKKYIETKEEFPVPSSIIGILEGRVSRDPAVYKAFLSRRKDGQFLSDEEHKYIRLYEAQTLSDWE